MNYYGYETAIVAQAMQAMLADPHVVEVCYKARDAIKHGAKVYFKWTCKGCGQRAVADTANTLTVSFFHDEPECYVVTPTVEGNLGFLLVVGL